MEEITVDILIAALNEVTAINNDLVKSNDALIKQSQESWCESTLKLVTSAATFMQITDERDNLKRQRDRLIKLINKSNGKIINKTIKIKRTWGLDDMEIKG